MSKHTGIILALLLIASTVNAGTVRFSWLPNGDEITSEYNIYCDRKTVAELDGASHELWRTVTEEHLADGRITYDWEGLPEEVRYYCVLVGVGIYDGKKVVSPFSSPELTFLIDTPPVPGIPQDGRIDMIWSVSVANPY